MIKIICDGVVTMPRGAVLKLSAEQAARREWALVPVDAKKNHFEVRDPVQFKHGEEFGFLGDPETLPRALRPETPAKKAVKGGKPESDTGKTGAGGGSAQGNGNGTGGEDGGDAGSAPGDQTQAS
jgi:hypothetical protein